VNGMSTWHFVTGRTRREQVFLTDGAVGLVLAVLAVVIVVESTIDAHSAVMTMFEVLRATDTTKAAVSTMIRAFLIGHPQIADVAMVFTKLDVARNAIVSVTEPPKTKTKYNKVRTVARMRSQSKNDITPISLCMRDLRLAALSSKALSADDLFDGEAINGVVCIFRGLIHAGE
jgi:hypothetical protein